MLEPKAERLSAGRARAGSRAATMIGCPRELDSFWSVCMKACICICIRKRCIEKHGVWATRVKYYT
jgi:hypothetical protein